MDFVLECSIGCLLKGWMEGWMNERMDGLEDE